VLTDEVEIAQAVEKAEPAKQNLPTLNLLDELNEVMWSELLTYNKQQIKLLTDLQKEVDVGLPDGRHFTANLAEASKKEAGILKICAWCRHFENKCIGVTPKRTNAELLRL